MSQPDLTLSVVSHDQGNMVALLFDDLIRLNLPGLEIVLTLNVPGENESWLGQRQSLPLTIIRNQKRLGFGANHNQAFAKSRGKRFCVVNPDIRLPDAGFLHLIEAIDAPAIGAAAPRVVDSNGREQDNIRRFPTFARLAKRVLLRRRSADYPLASIQEVDWAAGMFLMFDRAAFEQVDGFDERFFMYLEDADICRRLGRAGFTTIFQPSATVIHDAQRSSHTTLRHLRWHAMSALRFLVDQKSARHRRSLDHER